MTKQDQIWYDNQVIGKDPLEQSMKTLSKDAGLSQLYTNHCMKATATTTLDEAGFEARDIMIVTSHKSERSIKSYSRQCPPKKKRAMLDTLAKEFVPTELESEETRPEEKSKPADQPTMKQKQDKTTPLW